MLGGSTLGIGVTMFLKDQFSGPAARVKASSKSMQQELIRAQEAQLRQQRNMYAGLAVGGVMALRGMGQMIKKASEFSYEMKFVQSITDAMPEQSKKLVDVAKRLGRETMFYPQAIAEGMRFMAMAGMSAKEVEKNIEGAVNLAGATKSELGGKGGAADIMTNVMKQFSVGFQYTTDVADKLAYGVTRANTNLFDLGEALKYSGSTSMDLNIALDESIAMIMALGNAGMQGSMAGVAMENSMRYMSRAFSSFASGPSKKALAELGLDVKDVTDQAGNLLTMTEIMKKMGQAIEQNFGSGMNVEKQAILQNIFGVRGKRAASLFLRNLQEFETFSNDVATKSSGHSSKVMADMMNTLKGNFMKLRSAWESMWISFTDKVGPVLIMITKGLTKTLSFMERIFDTRFIGGFLSVGIAGFITLKTVSFAYRSIQAGIRLLHLQNGTSSVTMANMVTSSYNRMTAASMRYAASSGAGDGLIRRNSAGRFIRSTSGRTGRAGQYVSTYAATKYASRFGARAGAGALGGMAARGILGRVVGIFGGPVGMALSFVLPGLIGGVIDIIRNSKHSTDKNTLAIEEANRKKIQQNSGFSAMAHMIKFMDPNYPEMSVMGTTNMNRSTGDVSKNSSMDKLTLILEKALLSKSTQPINIFLDGELSVQKVIEKHMADSLSIAQ